MRKRNGFTAWELLAVCAVIAAVGTLLMPVLARTPIGGGLGNASIWSPNDMMLSGRQSSTPTGRAATCVSNLKFVSLAICQYIQDYDERYPIVSSSAGSPKGATAFGWAAAIHPYIQNTKFYQCPSEKNRGRMNPMASGYIDYWYNGQLAQRSLGTLRSPLITLTVGDGDGGSRSSDARYSLKALPKAWVTTANSPARRHMNTGCYAFADGHVERLQAKEVGTKAASFAPR